MVYSPHADPLFSSLAVTFCLQSGEISCVEQNKFWKSTRLTYIDPLGPATEMSFQIMQGAPWLAKSVYK